MGKHAPNCRLDFQLILYDEGLCSYFWTCSHLLSNHPQDALASSFVSLDLLEDAQLQLDELEATYFQILKGVYRARRRKLRESAEQELNTGVQKPGIAPSAHSAGRTLETILPPYSLPKRLYTVTVRSPFSAFEHIFSVVSGICWSGVANSSWQSRRQPNLYHRFPTQFDVLR